MINAEDARNLIYLILCEKSVNNDKMVNQLRLDLFIFTFSRKSYFFVLN